MRELPRPNAVAGGNSAPRMGLKDVSNESFIGYQDLSEYVSLYNIE